MARPLRVLFVEDREQDVDLLILELRRGGYAPTRERVDTPEAFAAALDRQEWDIILCDYRMPRFGALEALQLFADRGVDLPFIVVSGTVGEETAVEALRAGANDFMAKGKLARLVPAIERELREAASRAERKKMQTQLRQAQKMEAVGQLAGGIAHDFNNILTAIIGFGELMKSGLPADHALQDEVREIRNAANRGASLTNQLLAFSRQQVLEPKVLSLNGLVENVKKMLHRVLGEHIVLSTVLDPALANVCADVGQLEQVIVNLAVNARDAMPQGGQLTIETANVELDGAYGGTHAAVQPGTYVLLAVSDTGSGMDAATLAHLFEPFFTTKEVGKGTGLGLATVYGIVKQSGGYIWVYSEPGHGTTFKVYLPRVEEQEEPSAPRRVAPVAEDLSGTETILLVEDEESVRRLVRMVLERRGYKVVESPGWQTALEIARHEGAIDLVVTDVVMPGVGGPELATRLQQLRPGVRVLFMSGYTDGAVVNHGLPEPPTAFIQKPFTPSEFLRKVREVLSS